MLQETHPENLLENARRYDTALMLIGLSHCWWQVGKKEKGSVCYLGQEFDPSGYVHGQAG